MLKLLIILLVLVAFLVRLLYLAWYLGLTDQESATARAAFLCLTFAVLAIAVLAVLGGGA